MKLYYIAQHLHIELDSFNHVALDDREIRELYKFIHKIRERRVKVNDIKRLVVFAILMENDEGIVEKSPDYIDEKYQLAMSLSNPEQLLDWNNIEKFKKWLKTWQ